MRCVKANLCRLACFADGSFTHALSLFSTLGMIRGEASPAAGAWRGGAGARGGRAAGASCAQSVDQRPNLGRPALADFAGFEAGARVLRTRVTGG